MTTVTSMSLLATWLAIMSRAAAMSLSGQVLQAVAVWTPPLGLRMFSLLRQPLGQCTLTGMIKSARCLLRAATRRRSSQWIRLAIFFQAEDGIRYLTVTGVQTCALPI